MPPERLRDKEPTPEVLQDAEQLRAIAIEEELPEGVLSERGILLSATLLYEMRQQYGDPNSDDYNPYHNEKHALNIIKRSWQLWKILQEVLPERFDDEGFEDLMIAGAGHDIINDPEIAKENPGQNETDSAQLVYGRMLQGGYNEERAQNVYDTIEATTVKRNEQGMIVQNNLRRGSRNPRKLVLAQADMNGIVMEGIPRMVSDAVDLYLEFTDTPVRDALHNPVGAINFFGTQAKYLSDRIEALPEDLDYYFDKQEKELVREVYRQYFSGASRDTISAARMLAEFPEITKTIVESSFARASNATQRGLGQIATAKKHIADQLRRVHKDRD